jgi:hypothetical protein
MAQAHLQHLLRQSQQRRLRQLLSLLQHQLLRRFKARQFNQHLHHNNLVLQPLLLCQRWVNR